MNSSTISDGHALAPSAVMQCHSASCSSASAGQRCLLLSESVLTCCTCSLAVHRLHAWLVVFCAAICTKTCWSDGNAQPPLALSLWADSPCSDLTCTPAPAQENVTGFCRLLEPGECDNPIICSRSEKQVLTTQEDDCCFKNKDSFKRRDIDGPLVVKYAV